MRHEFTTFHSFVYPLDQLAMNHEHSDGKIQSPCESLLDRPRKALGLSLFFVLGATGGDGWDGTSDGRCAQWLMRYNV